MYSQELFSVCKIAHLMLKVIVLGDCGVGKSSLVNKLVWSLKKESTSLSDDTSDESPDDSTYNPTIGIKFVPAVIAGVNVQLWDCSGHDSFQSLRVSHFKKAHG